MLDHKNVTNWLLTVFGIIASVSTTLVTSGLLPASVAVWIVGVGAVCGLLAHQLSNPATWPQVPFTIDQIPALAQDVADDVKASGAPAALQTEAQKAANLAGPATKAVEVAKSVGLLALLLCLAVSAHAQVSASFGGLLGSSTWEVSDGGAWVAGGSTVAGGELNLGYCSTDSNGVFSPMFVVMVGAAGENHNGTNYANALLGGGPVIPGTAGIPLIVAADWRIFSGKQYPSVMLGTSFQFGKPFWISK